jgi:hypothetical protein
MNLSKTVNLVGYVALTKSNVNKQQPIQLLLAGWASESHLEKV